MPEERDERKAAVKRVCAASAALFSRTTEDNDNRVPVEIFGSFTTLNVCVFLSNVDLSLWGVVKPAENKDKDKDEDKKLKSQTTMTTAMHKDRVQKWADVLNKVESLCDAKNDKNGVSKEGDVERPIGVDNKEKSGE